MRKTRVLKLMKNNCGVCLKPIMQGAGEFVAGKLYHHGNCAAYIMRFFEVTQK